MRHRSRLIGVFIGVAAASDPGGCDLTGLLDAADRALHNAEAAGRNRVRLTCARAAEHV